MPNSLETQFPLSITILCYSGVFLLFVILLLLFRINVQLAKLSIRLSKSSRSSKLAEPEPQHTEAEPDTPFEEFLNEDMQRRSLSKKDQSEAYRKWRSEKGLNWTAKD